MPTESNKSVFHDLPDIWKAISIIIGAISLGIVVGTFSVGFSGLPDLVGSNRIRIDSLRAEMGLMTQTAREFDRRVDRLICIMEAERTETSPLRCN